MPSKCSPTASNSRQPSTVRLTPRGPRSNRRRPSRSSSWRIWWLSALTVRLACSAARDSLPWRATSTNCCSRSSESRVILNFLQGRLAKISLFRRGATPYLALVPPPHLQGIHHALALRRPAAAARPCAFPRTRPRAGSRGPASADPARCVPSTHRAGRRRTPQLVARHGRRCAPAVPHQLALSWSAGHARTGMPGRGAHEGSATVNRQAINFQQKLALFAEPWQPRVVAEMNDYQFKLVRLVGDFVWHAHADTDEVFIVLEGRLRIDFRDGAVELAAGEMFVVPKGVEHKP